MTEQRIKIKIGIDGKVYSLDTSNRESLIQIPWESRKKIIEVLESVKQAEHVETAKAKETFELQNKTVNQRSKLAGQDINLPAEKDSRVPELDSKDPDTIMQQLIIQQQNQHHIPDKGTVVKWMLVVFIVFILIMMVF